MKLLIIVPLICLLFLLTGLRALPAYSMDFTEETIYFIVLDRFSQGDPGTHPPDELYSPDKSEWKLYWGGDLEGVIDKLPYIKSLGATAIWITPIVENTDKIIRYGDEKISAYHGYWAKDFKRINPYFGSMETFERLVEEAHKNDIKIILDIVLNHTSPNGQGDDGAIYDDGEFVADFSNDPNEWFHHNGSTDFTILEDAEWQDKSLFDLTDFNQDNPDVDRYLKDFGLFWVDKGIDAFRIDTVRHVPCEFIKAFANEMYEKRDIFIFGEWSFGNFRNEADREFAEEGIIKFEAESDISVIDFNLQEAITATLARNETFNRITDAFNLDYNAKDPWSWVTCVDNHDMPRFISTAIANGFEEEDAKKRFEMAIYLIMTSRGIPCIYYGSEQLIHNDTPSTWGVGGEPYNRQMMEDFSTDGEFFKNISKLAKLRKENSAISKGRQFPLLIDEDFYVYERQMDENVVLVAMNKGEKVDISTTVSLPDGIYSEEMGNKLLGPDITVENGEVSFTLEEYDVGVWIFKKNKCNNCSGCDK